MDIIKNPIIKPTLESRQLCDLYQNNKRLNVIIPLVTDPKVQLEKLFHNLISGEKTLVGHYNLHNLFTLAQMTDHMNLVNLIISTVESKLDTIKNAIFDSNGKMDDINIGMYIQIWQSYKHFTKQMYHLVKNYQTFLVNKNIKIGNIYQNLLSIIQMAMFYRQIIGSDSLIIDKVSGDLVEVNSNNIEQLISYIDSIRSFVMVKDFVSIDKEKLTSIIKKIINGTAITNTICAYLHSLLIDFSNNCNNLDVESKYSTCSVNSIRLTKQNKIYKVATILAMYSDSIKLNACYTKFMQARIIDTQYNNIDMEIELVKILSGNIGKQFAQKLMDAISDIINSKKASALIKAANIKIKSKQYQDLAINASILDPIVINKKAWKIFNTSELQPNFPLEMKCYLDIASKSYASIYESKYVVNWQPTLGLAQFEADLGVKKIFITCNVLQAIALLYLNEHKQTTVTDFASQIMINPILADKILTSLYEANLIIDFGQDDGDRLYIINTQNYTGEYKIDIRKHFVEAFETSEKIKKIQEDIDAVLSQEEEEEEKPKKNSDKKPKTNELDDEDDD